MKRALDFMQLVAKAHSYKENYEPEAFATKTASLLYSAYPDFVKLVTASGGSADSRRENVAFISIQRLLTYLMMTQESPNKHQYPAYQTFAQKAGYVPLRFYEVEQLYDDLTNDQLFDAAECLKSMREGVLPTYFELMVLGLLCFALIDDKRIGYGDFFVIKTLFEDVDTIPATFDDFKAQYNK